MTRSDVDVWVEPMPPHRLRHGAPQGRRESVSRDLLVLLARLQIAGLGGDAPLLRTPRVLRLERVHRCTSLSAPASTRTLITS